MRKGSVINGIRGDPQNPKQVDAGNKSSRQIIKDHMKPVGTSDSAEAGNVLGERALSFSLLI